MKAEFDFHFLIDFELTMSCPRPEFDRARVAFDHATLRLFL